MKISTVPWSELNIGRTVVSQSLTDRTKGVIALIEDPMIWIAWEDGNRQGYNKAYLDFVELLDERSVPLDINVSELLREREIPDAEGE